MKLSNKSLIFSLMASIGVGATAFSAAKEAPKALKAVKDDSKFKHYDENSYSTIEAIKSGWKYYIPTFVIGASTVACIFISHGINRKEQKALLAAYGILKKSYDDYRAHSINVYGEDAEKKIFQDIATNAPLNVITAKDPMIEVPGLCENSGTDFCVDEEHRLFFDVMSERYFESTISRVLQAQYHINRNFTLGAPVSQNDYYEFLGLPEVPGGDKVGWTVSDGLYWIDFDNYKGKLNNGITALIIEPVFWPDENYLDY